jgi:D-amino-acid dehydrogenase
VCGSLLVAVSGDEREAFDEASAGAPREDGVKGHGPRVVSERRAKELFPPLGRVTGAVYAPSAARVDGRLMAAALERAAVGRGLQKRSGSVERLEAGRGRVTAVVADGERIEAGHVVIAGGAWSEALGRQLKATIPVEPQRGQIAHLDLGEVDTRGWPIVSGMRHHYLVPWDDHRVVAGATRETGSGFSAATTVAGIAEVMFEALRVAPGLSEASVREVRVGLRPVSADGYPVIGRVPNVANALVATGHGAMGLHLGPFSGRLVAEMIADGAPSCDVGAFGADRFGTT